MDHGISGSSDKTIKVWGGGGGCKFLTTLTGHKDYVFSLVKLSNWYFISGSYSMIKIWDDKSFRLKLYFQIMDWQVPC